MNTTQSTDTGHSKGKKAAGSRLPQPPTGRSAGATIFFIKSEKELEQSQQRGRKKSRSTVVSADGQAPGTMAGSSFGVQSLDAAMNEGSLSRTARNSSAQSSTSRGELSPARGKKIKSGNRVHPTILATGQRIISSDRTSSVMSPTLADSPSKHLLFRSNSGTSADMSAPLTPIKLSPHREAISPSTPRSGSPKSFRLSDEEHSVRDETGSQAICSSSGDEGQSPDLERTPQLVMPSLSMPVRRPFTDQGRRTGRAKIMVVGPKRVGKTSFIHSLYRSCEHIVHMDQVTPSIPSQSSFMTESSHYMPTTMFNEIGASTRSYPAWWTDSENRRTIHRRLSVGEGVLERNLTFVDTPGLEGEDQIQQILNHVKLTLRRTAHMDSMSDSEIISLLSGDGGVQIDAVIYLFEPSSLHGQEQSPSNQDGAHDELLRYLGKWTNLIPVVAQADTLSSEALSARKSEVAEHLDGLQIPRFELGDSTLSSTLPALPLGVSSAPGDDTEEVDASVLMSSQYLRPLATSDLGTLVDALLEPSNIARMRHTSATKFLLWRQQNVTEDDTLHKQTLLQSPQLGYHSRVTSAGSLLDDPSKVLVPHSLLSYHRSASPAISDISGQFGPGTGASTQALAHYNEQTQAQQPTEPFKQVRLAKWAQDLQRSLNNERRKYEPFYAGNVSGWPSADREKNDQALVSTREGYQSKRGRLGGDIGVFDPRDPLGVLALGQTVRQRGFVLLQVVGGAGLLGAAAYWIMRHWLEVQDFLGIGQPSGMVTTTALPPPTPQRLGHWLDEEYLRGFFGWGR
ncbi:Putative P-loop containing nucleoside triphosphate hydrolase [Septoria linicola]|uniref:P-loop containing nucleoside triphosphate hydrolase n=1 Tax=Septoria linicola TaxID=215465 RepID=A0A9Q9ALK3_9PEZI|nr:putative P-loop containing nucleoside triphosphate hydrolase [Septoria linicola]USW48343.1 Putative P-loop containing nucleoside triphosphate hydrolase [Septoria linicola]